jgi:sulfate adenylyltransferase subunit 1
VAYRYFATPKRKFIIADTPGHIQYTRNMVTGASTANLAIILVDARNGVLEQTRRHTYIAHLLNIPHLVFCVNKMDLVNFDMATFDLIKAHLKLLAGKLGVNDAHFIPISAKDGDNVVEKSERTPWYQGPTLLNLLENIEIKNDLNMELPRFPVQFVIRPQSNDFHDYRGYSGRVASGIFKPGDAVKVLPSGISTTITEIDFYKDQLSEAIAQQSVTIQLADDIDISRGDMIVAEQNQPNVANSFSMDICWFNATPLNPVKKYILRHTSSEAKCMVKSVNHKTNIETYARDTDDKVIKMNDIANLTVMTSKPIFYDSYRQNRVTGSVILIDEGTNETVAAGMIN